MRTIFKIHPVVQDILETKPETRNSDDILYIEYINRINPTLAKNDLSNFLRYRAMYGIPSIETVGRCRRKIQREHPMLRASKSAEDARYEQFKEVMEYVKK